MAVLEHLTEVLRQHLVLRQSGAEYGKIRDQFMAQNALWIREFEGKFFDNTSLFLSAHNGHVMKESVIVGTEKVMGQILSERLQEQYAVIVTDFLESTFFASDMMSQEYQTFSVKNTDTRGLISIFSQAGVSPAFLNISELDTSSHESVLQYLEKRQPITVIGAVFSKMLEGFPSQYTQKITPKKAFDAMIFFKNLTPYTKLPSHDEE